MNPEELLKEGLNQLGFSYSRRQIDAFMTFLIELKKWNRAYNLTSLRTDRDIIIKHFIDSLLYLKEIEGRGLKIADAGTGAGFPGIPMKIIKPEIDMTLIESRRKKSLFLRHIVRRLNLDNIHVLNYRIEGLGKEYEKTFDVIVSRATFKIKDFINKAHHYVKDNGSLILSKGQEITAEETEGLSGKWCIKKIKRSLPLINIERQLIIIEQA
jgi:16S rRNA (guanine527-N7)-methyltransferase